MDFIQHADLPTVIHEQEALAIFDLQHAGFIERNIGAMADEATCYTDDDVKDCLFDLALFNRCLESR